VVSPGGYLPRAVGSANQPNSSHPIPSHPDSARPGRRRTNQTSVLLKSPDRCLPSYPSPPTRAPARPTHPIDAHPAAGHAGNVVHVSSPFVGRAATPGVDTPKPGAGMQGQRRQSATCSRQQEITRGPVASAASWTFPSSTTAIKRIPSASPPFLGLSLIKIHTCLPPICSHKENCICFRGPSSPRKSKAFKEDGSARQEGGAHGAPGAGDHTLRQQLRVPGEPSNAEPVPELLPGGHGADAVPVVAYLFVALGVSEAGGCGAAAGGAAFPAR
jgi:hypothetical protein